MTFGLATRITLALVVILAAGVGMTTLLSAHMFERTLSDFLTSRFEFELNDIRQRIETQMDLGIALAELQSVPQELEEYLRADEQILSIEVFDDTGIVLFSTDPSFVGDLVTEEWVTAWRASRGQEVWSDLERDARVVGVPLRDNLGRDVGSPDPSVFARPLRRQRHHADGSPVTRRRGGRAGHDAAEHPWRHDSAARIARRAARSARLHGRRGRPARGRLGARPHAARPS